MSEELQQLKIDVIELLAEIKENASGDTGLVDHTEQRNQLILILQDLESHVTGLLMDIIDAFSDGPYSSDIVHLRDQLILILQKIQDDLSTAQESEIITRLISRNADLAALNIEIDIYSRTLDETFHRIKSIAHKVGIVADIVAGIASSGIL